MASGRDWLRILRWVAFPLAVAFWGCGASVRPAQLGHWEQAEQAPWLELVTPHFVIHTDLAEPRARHVARSLEDARAALLAGGWPGAEGPPGRTHVVVFAKPSELNRYTGLPGYAPALALTRPGFERWLAFSPGVDNGIPRAVRHALVHDLSQWFMPLQPPWLAEGLAGYLEGARIDTERHEVVIGEPSPGLVDSLGDNHTLMSSSKLFAGAGLHSPDPREGPSFYASAWLLVHHLLNERGEAFGQFQRRLMRLVPWRRAWEESFPGLWWQELDASMSRYARTGEFSLIVETFEPSSIEPSVRALSPARVHGTRALLETIQNRDAQAEIEAATRLDPDELLALTARFHSGKTDERIDREIGRRAIAAHPDEAEAWLLAAWAAAPEKDERRRALERAFALAPHHPGIAWLLAHEELAQGHPQRALELIRLAERRSGLSVSMLVVHVRALVALRRCDDAERLVEGGSSLLAPMCRMFAPEKRRYVTCGEYVRATYQAATPSCNPAERAANLAPPPPQQR